MLEAVSRQQRYVDISQDDLSELQKAIDMEENRPHFRAFSKKSLAELQRPLEERVPIVAGPHVGEKRGFEEVVGSRGGQSEHGQPRFRADVSEGTGKPGDDERSSKRQALQKHLRGPLLQRLGRGTHQESGPGQQSHEGLRDLPSTSADSRTGIGRKRRPSTSVDTYEDRERLQELEVRALGKDQSHHQEEDDEMSQWSRIEDLEQDITELRQNGVNLYQRMSQMEGTMNQILIAIQNMSVKEQ